MAGNSTIKKCVFCFQILRYIYKYKNVMCVQNKNKNIKKHSIDARKKYH